MLKKLFLLCIAAGVIATPASAQLSLDAAYFEAMVGRQLTVTSYRMTDLSGVDALAGLTGDDLTYDFNAFPYDAGEVSVTVLRTPSADLPGAQDPDFAEANYVAVSESEVPDFQGTAYGYYVFQDDGLFLLGLVVVGDFDEDGQDDEAAIKSTPPQRIFAFPLTMGTAWTATYDRVVDLDGMTITTSVREDVVVDGWGTLRTPGGEAACLRLAKTKQETFFGITTVTTTLDFITQGDVSADIILDGGGAVIAAGYEVIQGEAPSAAEAEADVPASTRLLQNYPNPFNGATHIVFVVRQPGPVTLTVYDLLGKRLGTLVDGVLPAGSHTASWQAGGLPGGLYVYRLRAGGVVLSRTMTLLK